MELDRRIAPRAGLGRRSAYRISDYRTVHWRRDDDEQPRHGWLVEWSEQSVALVIEKADTPLPGVWIIPCRGPHIGWYKPAMVTRMQPLSSLLNLTVAEYASDDAEICERQVTSQPSEIQPCVTGDRRVQKRSLADRRRSGRWETKKSLQWRIPRSRRVRESQLVSRSLDGLVLLADSRDAPDAGSRILPSGPEVGNRFGFRSAVVRRTESPSADMRLIFAEIEA